MRFAWCWSGHRELNPGLRVKSPLHGRYAMARLQFHILGTPQSLPALAMRTGLLELGHRDEGIARGQHLSLHFASPV